MTLKDDIHAGAPQNASIHSRFGQMGINLASQTLESPDDCA
jgi:hypothetical protein